MEDAFLELYQEFKKLQIICAKQAELLQKLLSKKGHTSELPVSKPIQCTDKGDDACAESPFFELKGKEDQCLEPSKTKADDVSSLEPKDSLLLDLAIRFPLCEDQYNYLASATDKEEAAAGMLSADKIDSESIAVNANYALLIKSCTPKLLDMDNIGDKIAPAKLYLDFLTPIHRDSHCSFSNMYEDIRFLHSRDISFGTLVEPHKNSNGVRGPCQSSWSPGCLSEDCPLGQRININSDVGLSSQICEFCGAEFPAGAATEGEFLGHLAGHME